jgi:hypothetical protein
MRTLKFSLIVFVALAVAAGVMLTFAVLRFGSVANAQAALIMSVDDLFDLQWKKLFHWLTLFESLDGWAVEGVPPSLTGSNVIVSTEAKKGSQVGIGKYPAWFGLATFSERSSFRTAFAVPDASLKNETIYIVVGNLYGSFYGFKAVDKTLFGVVSNGGTLNEETVKITDKLTSDPWNIEARYFPNNKVDFHWSGSGDYSAPAATIGNSGRLPLTAKIPNNFLANIRVVSHEDAQKTVQLSFFEYLQTRSALR